MQQMYMLQDLKYVFLFPCRNPGSGWLALAHWCFIFISWVLVRSRSKAGKLFPRRLSKGDVWRTNVKSGLWSPCCLLWAHLRDLRTGIVEAFAEHKSHQERPQQCNNEGRCSPHRRRTFKHHRMDSSGRLCCPTWAFHSQAWIPPLFNTNQWWCHSGDWWSGYWKLCHRISADGQNRNKPGIIKTTKICSCLWCLPGHRWWTGGEFSIFIFCEF